MAKPISSKNGTCNACGQPVVAVTYGPAGAAHTLFLTADVPCFAAVAFDAMEPVAGDKVFKSLALPLHSATCPAQWEKAKKGEKAL